MKNEEDVLITSSFSLRGSPLRIDFDPKSAEEGGNAGRPMLVIGGVEHPLIEVKELLLAFEDKFPFALAEKEG